MPVLNQRMRQSPPEFFAQWRRKGMLRPALLIEKLAIQGLVKNGLRKPELRAQPYDLKYLSERISGLARPHGVLEFDHIRIEHSQQNRLLGAEDVIGRHVPDLSLRCQGPHRKFDRLGLR